MNNFWPNNFQPRQDGGGNFPPHQQRPHFHPQQGFPPNQYHHHGNMRPPRFNPVQMCPPNPGFNPLQNPGFDPQRAQMRPPNMGFNHPPQQMCPPNPGYNPPPQMCPPENLRFNPPPPFHQRTCPPQPPFGVADVAVPNRCFPPPRQSHDCDVITPEKIVEQFMQRRSNSDGGKVVEGKEERTKKGNVLLKIHEAQSVLREAKSLVEKLKSSQQCDDDMVKDRLRLQHLTSLLQDEELREDVKKKVEQRKKRRNRMKRKKKQNAHDRKVEMEKWQAEHQRIDEWQANEKAKLDEQRAEEKRQEEIEESLTEIKKEKAKISKCIAFVNTLAKLRKARYKSSLNEGKPVSEEATRSFEERAEEVGRTLARHGKICSSKEEQVTKLMKNKQEARAECLNAELKNKQLQWQQSRKQVLFGNDKDVSDELRPIAQLHQQTESNIQNFLICRQHWDVHVNQRDGTAIPIDWVEPAAPSSDEWAKYLLPE